MEGRGKVGEVREAEEGKLLTAEQRTEQSAVPSVAFRFSQSSDLPE